MKSVVFALCFLYAFAASAAEEILNFTADINVQTDASVVVVEDITVMREGRLIKRGIFRDLPLTKGVTYRVLDVRRDGRQEPYFVEKKGGFYRINTGTDDFLPDNRAYTFTIAYQAFNVVSPFEKYDEVYWNVTGNGWAFPIQNVTARVNLPDDAAVLKKAVYVGASGNKERGMILDDEFSSARPLAAGEGLTVAVGFEKGKVDFPPLPRYGLLTAFAGAVLLLYMAITWAAYGKDPPKEEVMPRFDVPKDVTAAQAAYVFTRGRNEQKCLAVMLIEAAVDGFTEIEEKEDFRVTTKRAPATPQEKFIGKTLGSPAVFSKKYNPRMKKFFTDAENFLSSATHFKYFTLNTAFTVVGAILAGGLTVGLAYLFDMFDFGLVLIFFLPFILTAPFVFKSTSIGGVLWVVMTLFQMGIFAYSYVTGNPVAVYVLGFFLASVAAVLLYSRLIFRPSPKGQKLLAHLDGLKMFMTAVHQDYPKEADFKKMEKLLPFAILFGIEKEWGEKMRKMADTFDYQPTWYHGRPFSVSRFGALTDNISSTCVPPRSSGSGGGGFSGGGCGGGGGGGR